MTLSHAGSILVVDDEAALRKTLRATLTASGFEVEEARTGEEAIGAVRRSPVDLVLLDMNMPGIGGIRACQEIRSMQPNCGIVVVTVRELEEDKVNALNAGADDYVTKPLRIRELTARLRAVLRRTNGRKTREPEILQAGYLKMNLQWRLLWRDGEEVHLSPTEFEFLAFLMKNEGLPLPRVKLLRSIWGPEYADEFEYLRAYVLMLRKKIEKDPSHPEYILTEPGVGYRFCNPSHPDFPNNSNSLL